MSTTDALKGYLPTPQRTLSLDTRHSRREGKKRVRLDEGTSIGQLEGNAI